MVEIVKVPLSCSKWNVFFIFGILFIWSTYPAGAQQDCVIMSPDPATVSETEPPGRLLLTLVGGPAAQWSFQITMPGLPGSQVLAPFFELTGGGGNATIVLNQTLDLEGIGHLMQDGFTIEFTISCSQPGVQAMNYLWFVSITAVNEFEPKFTLLPEGGFNISEAEKIGDTILLLQDYVEDKDLVLNHRGFDFALLPIADAAVDGRQKFELASTLTGALAVREELDYEALSPDAAYYILNVSVGDRDGMVSSGTVRINIVDADDLPPEFYYPDCSPPCFANYEAAIRDDFEGEVTWLEPAPIAARDRDTLGSPVTYRFRQGEPKDFADYLTINGTTGVPFIIKKVADSDAPSIFAIVEAVEDSPLKHSEQTTLRLKVIGRNSSEPTLPPVIVEKPSEADSAFRTATIVLGVFFALVLIILVVLIICTMSGNSVRTSPVLPKTIGKLSSDDEDLPHVVGSVNSTKRKSRKSVTLAKAKRESRLDFFRSLKKPRPDSPTLKSYTSSHDQDIENLPVSNEIDFDHNGMVEEPEEDYPDHQEETGVSIISDSDVVPFEDRMHLVYGEDSAGQERMGMSNPVYESHNDEDPVEVGVIPAEDKPVYI